MREYIEIYNQHKEKIEVFIEESIENLAPLCNHSENNFKLLFNTFPSLELVYVVNSITKEQTSANIYKYKVDESEKDKDRTYLLERLEIKDNDFAFAQPYQSSATSNLCITVSKKEGQNIVFMDLRLEMLLERLGLIEKDKIFSNVVKAFYMFAGYFMMFLSGVAIFYAGSDFLSNFLASKLSIDTIFKPIIAATLGLAIFDLSKTILEQEVYFKSYIKDSKIEIKTLTKFLVTILIALSIETLMVVFKIAIENYDKMINALYLMIGTSTFIISLSVLIYMTKKSKEK
ncbi:MAG: hypothetical protein A2513_00685 [Sulfurimonas sp. RIFOXYD12_FULL_33_39]|uniref:hypothetical protein n=1 Tax=unclassified Sulfurimonas TaxID=2623549 RepID=UPI0008D86B69|nr:MULTISPECIES: hypothetical protein [unclassified Sulfurimonas]OHE10839.1 MAG: hypothetical protein A2513_00685 [Sulfurimonas sp. RIFOXYD12_FULL_33_39]OHE13391.1 MAG: hypothetical protein A2530_07495 [Sulfurimonas sp. RIFOXYD2_FULL_34_21]